RVPVGLPAEIDTLAADVSRGLARRHKAEMARFTWRIVDHALIAPFHGQAPIRSRRSVHSHRHPLGLFLPAAQAGFSLAHPFRPRPWSLNREGQTEQVSAAQSLDTGHAQRAGAIERAPWALRGERLEGAP